MQGKTQKDRNFFKKREQNVIKVILDFEEKSFKAAKRIKIVVKKYCTKIAKNSHII